MKISILLPYKENYSPSYPGAVSIFVNSTNKISSFKNDITVYGSTHYKDKLSRNYINISLSKKILQSQSKEYVDNTIETRSLAFSMDLSDGKPNSYISGTILTQLAPPADFRNGSLARILCTTLQNSTTSLEINPLRSETRDDFNLTSGGSASALQQMAFNTATVAAPAVTTLRVIKTFQLVAGAWSFVSEVSLP